MKSRPGRRMGIEPIGAVLRRDGDLRLPSTVEASPVALRDWELAVGTRIAARARPFRLESGVLWVRTATATWAQELTLLADAIVGQLATRGIKVRSLRFKVGEVAPPERPPDRSEPRRAPAPAPLPPALADELGRVGDEALRQAIAEAAAKNLGWQVERSRTRAAPGPGRDAKERSAPATSGRRAAPGPRSAGPGTAPPARTSPSAPAARRGKP